MISRLANLTVRCFLKHSDIKDDEQDLYQYGFFILLSQILYFIIAGLAGILFGAFFESIIFYIAFQFIRRYAGGYHASTETRCEIMSTLSIVACIAVIRASKTYDFHYVLLIISAVSALIIAVLCPLDTPEKPLSDAELKYFRKISLIILLVIIAVIAVSYIWDAKFLIAPCCMSLILEGILISAGKIKKVSQKKIVKTQQNLFGDS